SSDLSVSIPKNGNEHSYMVYENATYTIKNLDGKEINSMKV
ncbi:MAG TPA: phosphodiesterase, partial [Lachnospiraceae bacterium]|nr:phosphodiesterase [Lachnospiraceae bacterium]